MTAPLRVLLVEDSESDAALALRVLGKAGYEVSATRVETAEDMRAALDAGSWDLVIADYRLPRFDAPGALRVLQESGHDLPFLVVSGTVGEDVAVGMMKAGAHDYLMKDNLTRLAPAVARELREAQIRRERRRAEEALRLQEERLRLAIDGAALGTWHWDIPSGRLFWSDRTYAMFGVPPGTPVTHADFLGRIHPDDRPSVDRGLRAALTDDLDEAEFRVCWPDGSEHWISAIGRVFRDQAGAPARMEGVVRDVSEQKRLEVQLRQAQKMEAIGRLAGGVAHDFNNLLGVIIGYSEMALRQLEASHATRGRIEEVLKAAERASQLTRQLLAFSRRQVLAPKVVDLNALLAEFEKMLRRVIGEDVEMVFRPGARPEPVRVDPGQLEQAVMNLVVNARDAMPRGGTLTLETADVKLDQPLATTHGPVPPGNYAVLSVKDTGEGIEPANLARIFEPFFTTKPIGEGTGLGLASVYGMVTQSGGHVEVASARGRGSCFRIYLPRVSEEAVASAMPPLDAESLRGDETVLIVEDQDGLREVIRETLAELGYSLLAADSGEEALAIAERHGGPVHLLLTDVVMPRVSGPELARRLALLRPEVKVLFISGYPDEVLARQGLSLAGHALLAKPFTRQALAQAVRTVLGPARARPKDSG